MHLSRNGITSNNVSNGKKKSANSVIKKCAKNSLIAILLELLLDTLFLQIQNLHILKVEKGHLYGGATNE